MKELIKHNQQGEEIVSARELYESLGLDQTHWSRWHKKNIVNNAFAIENVDWVGFALMANGNESRDFALTPDFAKKLAMMVRTEQGERVRDYFLECERRAKSKTSLPAMSHAEALLQSVQIMVNMERKQLETETKQNALEYKVDKIIEEQSRATEKLLLVERSTERVPEETTKMKIRKLVNEYCFAKNTKHKDVYHMIYDRLYYRYGVSLRAIVRKRNESALDVAEKLGHIDKIFIICSSELV